MLRFNKGQPLAKGHTMRGWEKQDLNLGLLVEGTFQLATPAHNNFPLSRTDPNARRGLLEARCVFLSVVNTVRSFSPGHTAQSTFEPCK